MAAGEGGPSVQKLPSSPQGLWDSLGLNRAVAGGGRDARPGSRVVGRDWGARGGAGRRELAGARTRVAPHRGVWSREGSRPGSRDGRPGSSSSAGSSSRPGSPSKAKARSPRKKKGSAAKKQAADAGAWPSLAPALPLPLPCPAFAPPCNPGRPPVGRSGGPGKRGDRRRGPQEEHLSGAARRCPPWPPPVVP